MKLLTPNEIRAKIHDDELIDLVSDLIRIPSHAQIADQEKQVGQFLVEWCQNQKIDVERQEVGEGRFNVIAMVPGHAPQKSKRRLRLMFNGHLDTVPPSAQMQIDPYGATLTQGRIYGRGAVDMKGGLGAMAYALKLVQESGVHLNGDLMLAAVVGEETGGHGTHRLVAQGPQADLAIVGEPTDLQILVAHKGVERFSVIVKGLAAHGSSPERGVNAISQAAKLITAIDEQLIPKLREQHHPMLGYPTLNIGTICGGTSRNTVPDRCVFQVGKRWLPGDSVEKIYRDFQDLVDRLKEMDPSLEVEIEREAYLTEIPHPPFEIPIDHPLVQTLRRSILEVTGREPAYQGMPFCTDASILSSGGVPTVVLGPGSYQQAHGDSEHIDVKQLLDATCIYSLVALKLLT
ncbi:MAG: M20 family metallopeptidase [Candidatus Bipolaricaulia bacterium]